MPPRPTDPQRTSPRLSRRERETLSQLVLGKTEKEVAVALDLSIHTVHQYVKSLHRAFGVTTRGALVARALTMYVPDLAERFLSATHTSPFAMLGDAA